MLSVFSLINIKLALTTARQVYLSRYRRVHDVGLVVSELCLLLPDHVSKLPPIVDEVFNGLSEKQKHSWGQYLIPEIKDALGSVTH